MGTSRTSSGGLPAFGVTLVLLDIREESTRHTLALDAITRRLGIGSYTASCANAPSSLVSVIWSRHAHNPVHE